MDEIEEGTAEFHRVNTLVREEAFTHAESILGKRFQSNAVIG